jgi:hypothetical protein
MLFALADAVAKLDPRLVKRPASFLDVPQKLSRSQLAWQLMHGITLFGGSFNFANVASE